MIRPPTPGSQRTSTTRPPSLQKLIGTAQPPEVHLVGERCERGRRIDRHLDLGRNRLTLLTLRHHLTSTCRLNERSWSSQCAWS